MKIPSWEGKEGLGLQGWVSLFLTTHPVHPSGGGEFSSSVLPLCGMDGSLGCLGPFWLAPQKDSAGV